MSVSHDHTARIWNTATGNCQAEIKGDSDWVISAVFSPDGRHFVSASHDHTARIWNTATGSCQAELKGHSHRVNSAVFSSDSRNIVSASIRLLYLPSSVLIPMVCLHRSGKFSCGMLSQPKCTS